MKSAENEAALNVFLANQNGEYAEPSAQSAGTPQAVPAAVPALERYEKRRNEIVASGIPLLSDDEIRAEIEIQRRGSMDQVMSALQQENERLKSRQDKESETPDPICHEKDNCPTEGAVLRREWRRLTAENERLKALPKMEDCLYHRCVKHYSEKQLNCTEITGAECGACVGEHEREAQRAVLRELVEALKEMCELHGGWHDDDCSLDDTCDCSHKPFNDKINAALDRAEEVLK